MDGEKEVGVPPLVEAAPAPLGVAAAAVGLLVVAALAREVSTLQYLI